MTAAMETGELTGLLIRRYFGYLMRDNAAGCWLLLPCEMSFGSFHPSQAARDILAAPESMLVHSSASLVWARISSRPTVSPILPDRVQLLLMNASPAPPQGGPHASGACSCRVFGKHCRIQSYVYVNAAKWWLMVVKKKVCRRYAVNGLMDIMAKVERKAKSSCRPTKGTIGQPIARITP